MKLQLFVSDTFAPCREAERVWRAVAEEKGMELAIIDINSEAGRSLAAPLQVNVVPAVAADGRLLAIGVQTPVEARSLIAEADAASPGNAKG